MTICKNVADPVAAPAPAPARAPAPAVAPPRSARAKSPGPAKSPRAQGRKESGIKVHTHVLAKHVAHGKSKFPTTVKSIDGDSCVIACHDKDETDTVKQIKDLHHLRFLMSVLLICVV